jgi:hypothetical protein
MLLPPPLVELALLFVENILFVAVTLVALTPFFAAACANILVVGAVLVVALVLVEKSPPEPEVFETENILLGAAAALVALTPFLAAAAAKRFFGFDARPLLLAAEVSREKLAPGPVVFPRDAVNAVFLPSLCCFSVAGVISGVFSTALGNALMGDTLPSPSPNNDSNDFPPCFF